MGINGALIAFVGVALHAIEQVQAGEDAAGVLQKDGQKLEFSRSQIQDAVIARWPGARPVQDQPACAENRLRRAALPVRCKTAATCVASSRGLNGLVNALVCAQSPAPRSCWCLRCVWLA